MGGEGEGVEISRTFNCQVGIEEIVFDMIKSNRNILGRKKSKN